MSESLVCTMTLTIISSFKVKLSMPAIGGSFTGLTVITTIAVSHKAGLPVSQTSYIIVSNPLKSIGGVYVMLSPFTTTAVTPCVEVPIIEVVKASPSTSVSLT